MELLSWQDGPATPVVKLSSLAAIHVTSDHVTRLISRRCDWQLHPWSLSPAAQTFPRQIVAASTFSFYPSTPFTGSTTHLHNVFKVRLHAAQPLTLLG